MYIHVVKEYQRWSRAGYVQPFSCVHHPYWDLIISVDGEGLFLLCPGEDYKHYLSAAEYDDIEKKLALVKHLFGET